MRFTVDFEAGYLAMGDGVKEALFVNAAYAKRKAPYLSAT